MNGAIKHIGGRAVFVWVFVLIVGCAARMESESVRSCFRDRGYWVVRGALSEKHCAGIVGAVAQSLKDGHHSEGSYMGGIDLDDRETWPHKKIGTHRVVEVVPGGSSANAFMALRESGPLKQALNLLFSRPDQDDDDDDDPSSSRWEIQANETPLKARHWYCPIAFPEQTNLTSLPGETDDGQQHSKNPTSEQSVDDRHLCVMGPIKELCGQAPLDAAFRPGFSPSTVARVWQPINRRRIIGRGWHIDVGPGFPNHGLRTTRGDHRQGVVLLLLLSDWDPGCGGTCVISGSHKWVFSKIKEHADSPLTHSQLNEWVVARMRALVTGDRVELTCRQFDDDDDDDAADAADENGPACDEKCTAFQITGKKGDVVLMHPLLVHSGTTNLCPFRPRILANGMACETKGFFEEHGDLMMQYAQM